MGETVFVEREFCPADEMTQKDDKINEENEFTDSLSGKQDVTSDPADPVPDTNVADQKDPEEEEEDVPADFFDDFSNQDFMDGLDIVDAWDDEPNVDAERARKKPHSPIRFIKSRTPDRKSKRRRSKSPGRPRRSNSKRSKSRENVRTTDRRDPEKTRRDIHRDKIKVAKDKEQKLVNDKLRIVETGLVPPGTEMDVDISTIITEKRKTEERQRERDVTRDRERERELARERERESARERERELAREREKESARERERELARERELVRERELIREREARDREQERQLARDRDREVVRERDLKNDREKRYTRRSSSRDRKRYSPSPRSRGREKERDVGTRSRRRTASRESNLSERELWIRSNRKRTRSRSRSRSKKYEEAKKKKTFLEEIRDKLNETRSVVQSITPGPPSYTYNSIVPQHSMPTPTPAPAPVPAPNQYFSPVPAQQYDQRFFIGDAYQPSNVNFGMIAPVPPVQVPQMRPVTAPAPVMTPTPVPPLVTNDQKPVFPHKINILSDIMLKTKTEEKKEVEKNPIEDIDKLFADKKISLSDFLTITAKCEVQSSSPDHLQKKIKVISRCQDAIKAMSDDHKFTGRLSVKQVTELKNKGDVKYQSPLRRIPIVRFQFTTPAKITEDTDVFALALDKILQRIGILKENTNMDEVAEVVTNSSFADEETTATTLKATLLGMKKTDAKSECEECKKRKMKTFTEVGSQCVDNKDTVSIGVQVLEEDFNSTKGLMKNDSIAYLTPAQLLGKEKEKDREIENPQSLKPEKSVDKKLEPAAASTSPMKKEKPRPLLPARGRGRGRGRAPLIRDRPFNNSFEYQDEYYDDFYDNGRNIYEDPRDSFGARFEHPLPVNYQRQEYIEDDAYLARLHQFREEEGGFLDFSQPYRGGPRGGRYGGPRF